MLYRRDVALSFCVLPLPCGAGAGERFLTTIFPEKYPSLTNFTAFFIEKISFTSKFCVILSPDSRNTIN
jgi:hypothetical protein